MPTMEHYFQAMKADSMYDYIAIATAKTPGAAKRAGRRAILRHDWEDVKEQVMEDGQNTQQVWSTCFADKK